MQRRRHLLYPRVSTCALMLATCVAILVQLSSAIAALPLRQLILDVDAKRPGLHLPRAFENARPSSVSFLLSHEVAPTLSSAQLVRISPHVSSVELPVSQLSSWFRSQPEWAWEWAPKRHLLLDSVEPFVHARAARQASGLTGKGTLVAIIDSGIDISHPDFRHADGSTRIRRLLDFSTPPRGLCPELEQQYNCTATQNCSVHTDKELNALLAGQDRTNDPLDVVGHGTHVASLAAGSGSADRRFVGMAPEAGLIVVRATRDATGGVLDADVLRGVAFAFEQASALGLPAVVNLSLGSDLGPHDGSSLFEQALAEMLGPEFPGRSIVVAGGNSGRVFSGITSRYPEPFGIHTEAFVARGQPRVVPVLSPHTQRATTRATVFVWLSFLPGDSVSIGIDDRDGPVMAPVAPQATRVANKGALEMTVLNGISPAGSGTSGPTAGSAVVVLDGEWPSGSVFGLRLVGHGTAQLWLESSGELNPAGLTPGALFPNAQREGTISIPAAHPELIAVGASSHRSAWTDNQGASVDVSAFGLEISSFLDSLTSFSAAGPNAFGDLKPEIVAPGLALIGALSTPADPRMGSRVSAFASFRSCPNPQTECFVVSDRYAVTTGTSMSAPLVTGAVALLLERNPQLTQPEIRNLLLASARRPSGEVPNAQQAGPGILDVQKLLPLLDAAPPRAFEMPDREQSWFSFSSAFVRPSGRSRLVVVAHLRSGQGDISEVSPGDIALTATPASLLEAPTQLAPGTWQAAFAAAPLTAGEELRVALRVRGQLILSAKLPIAVDYEAGQYPLAATGGCALGSSESVAGPGTAAYALLLLTSVYCLRRRRTLLQSGTFAR